MSRLIKDCSCGISNSRTAVQTLIGLCECEYSSASEMFRFAIWSLLRMSKYAGMDYVIFSIRSILCVLKIDAVSYNSQIFADYWETPKL